MKSKQYRIWFGTHSRVPNEEMVNNNIGGSIGIYTSELNGTTGELSDPVSVFPMASSVFMDVDRERDILYVVGKRESFDSPDEVHAFKIDRATGQLEKWNSRTTEGVVACHVAFDPQKEYLGVANYTSGSFALFRLQANGDLGELIDLTEYSGTGPNPVRQTGAKIHSSYFLRSADELRILIPDLGTDSIHIRKRVANTDRFIPDPDQDRIAVKPGSGPRHVVLLNNTQLCNTLFVLNELDSTVEVFRLYTEGSRFRSEFICKESVIPDDFRTATSDRTAFFGSEAAEIELSVSSSGPIVSVSNRGHNSIAVFNVGDFLDCSKSRPQLKQICFQSTFGVFPRFFSSTPNGDFLVADNERSGTIVVLRRNRVTGELEPVNRRPTALAWPQVHIILDR